MDKNSVKEEWKLTPRERVLLAGIRAAWRLSTRGKDEEDLEVVTEGVELLKKLEEAHI